MAESTEKTTVPEGASDLSDEMLEQVEARQRAAIQAVRKFIDHLDDVMPNLVDDPSTRKKVVEAIGDYYEQLATTTNEFVARMARGAIGTVRKPGDDAKDLYQFLRSFRRGASETVNESAANPAAEGTARKAAAKGTAKPG